jgi:mono/diheme cytochrome c family protein
MLLRPTCALAALALTAPAVACAPAPPRVGGATPGVVSLDTFSQIGASILAPRCAGCHGVNAPSLEVGQAYASLVNVPSTRNPDLLLVAPFDPAGSYLVQVLRGSTDLAMPPGDPLSEVEVQAVEAWIDAGAPND